ncbi:SpoIIE family protein phosphatase [Isachenkonia alkalipeptolytica]|uniref:Serine/threonine-protein phosphatase n=1 Tax=Isachenkonia alkalipeptolytica TaxID=2565777 RepID=A0AA43XN11_9CLOT|nr:SpoIIE family protein phosphatase [Isachenkonia alkalipeptolytica]NBG89284.1 serine/threonine-protein phosphatase [Isachenkonia alkalipeptolytica]
MELFYDFAYDSLNKMQEELCGDKVEVVEAEDSTIIVLADGLGSGVKANILATMTTKIAGTMLKEGASIDETIETIAKTLPVCNIRKLAYSTFIIMKISKTGKVHLIEYDNPPVFMVRNNKSYELKKKEKFIHGKKILESIFQLKEGDMVTLVSDGVIHAGVGGVLNLGWQWSNVEEYLIRQSAMEKTAKGIANKLMSTCAYLYEQKPGDDTTVVSLRARKPETLDVFSGPPEAPEQDPKIVEAFMKGRGKKVVCGGTAANIVSRELQREVEVLFETGTDSIPPRGKISGIDFVTEGVITLSHVVENIEDYRIKRELMPPKKNKEQINGAELLTRVFLEDSTHLNFYVGKAINPAHQNPDLPKDLSIKLRMIDQLKSQLEALGKKVKIHYY